VKLRILVADDSVLFRRVLVDVLASLPEVEVVGTASNGKLALQRIAELRPDVLTLDMEMPEIDGMGVLDTLRRSGQELSVIVVSALTLKGGQLTMRALEKGAFDFITKPEGLNGDQSREAILRDLGPRIRALAQRLEVRSILRNRPTTGPAPTAACLTNPKPAIGTMENISSRMHRISGTSKPEMVLIGVSTGGPNALSRLLPALPGNLGVPILIVQHMPPVFTQSLAESLSAKCAIRVREAKHGEKAEANIAYIAPGGHQMRLQREPDGSKLLLITDDPPENNCRPAVDYLFRSAANHFPGQSMAVILTGMGSDGTIGLRLLRRHGCFSIVQDEASCVVYGMPKAAVDAGLADAVLPLDGIAARITTAIRGGAT
jgi:two-component system chemotaxis response regulator CheB